MTFQPQVPPNSRLKPLWQAPDQIANNGNRYEAWVCKCKCGETCIVRMHRLERGTTKSCGCLRREMAKQRIEIARAAHVEAARKRNSVNAQ